MASLIPAGDPPAARCAICGATAAGPCARCRKMVCADCCELVQGAGTFALCTRCAKSPSLGWPTVLGWVAAIILVLGAIAGGLMVLRR
jgi:hypothetical protein